MLSNYIHMRVIDDVRIIIVENTTMSPVKRSSFVKYIDQAIEESGVQEEHIATYLGFGRASTITSFRDGLVRVPIDKVRQLGSAIGVDEFDLITRWLQDYMPELIKALDESGRLQLRPHESRWVNILRRIYPEGVPPPPTGTEGVLQKVLRG